MIICDRPDDWDSKIIVKIYLATKDKRRTNIIIIIIIKTSWSYRGAEGKFTTLFFEAIAYPEFCRNLYFKFETFFTHFTDIYFYLIEQLE
jgi:hypothetical protein